MDASDFPDDDVETPTCEMYGDKEGGGQPQALDAKDITPEAYDCSLNAEVLLQREHGMKMGTVKHRKCDADGDLQGLENANSILDTRTYEVKFLDVMGKSQKMLQMSLQRTCGHCVVLKATKHYLCK